MSVETFWTVSTKSKSWLSPHSIDSSNLDEYYDMHYSSIESPYENFRLLVVF